MPETCTDAQFDALVHALARCRGADRAVTLATLAAQVGMNRRSVEATIEERLGDFPFLLVAGSTGYYIPTTADDINRYVHSLHSRHRRMQIREQTVIHKARASGWPWDGTAFLSPPNMQQELFA